MFYTYEYTQYIFSSAHSIIYTALSTLYLRALHPDRMFGIKLNNKVMDVPLVCRFDYSFSLFLTAGEGFKRFKRTNAVMTVRGFIKIQTRL